MQNFLRIKSPILRFIIEVISVYLFWSFSAIADAGVPMIAMIFPGAVFAIIPIIILEALILKEWFKSSIKLALKNSTLANLLSTLFGIPLAAIVYMKNMWHQQDTSCLIHYSPLVEAIRHAPWLCPGYTSSEYRWMTSVSLLILLIPCFIISVWIEGIILRFFNKTLPATLVWKACVIANLISYIFLLVTYAALSLISG